MEYQIKNLRKKPYLDSTKVESMSNHQDVGLTMSDEPQPKKYSSYPTVQSLKRITPNSLTTQKWQVLLNRNANLNSMVLARNRRGNRMAIIICKDRNHGKVLTREASVEVKVSIIVIQAQMYIKNAAACNMGKGSKKYEQDYDLYFYFRLSSYFRVR